MSEFQTLELLTIREAIKVAKIDSSSRTDKIDEYIRDNSLSYYVLTNTWLMLIRSYTNYGWMRVKDQLLSIGLVKTIERFDNAATRLVQGVEMLDPLCESLQADIYRNTSEIGIPEKTITTDPLASLLAIFRYPKRFSPVHNDIIAAESLKTFLANENYLKMKQRNPINPRIIRDLRDVISHLVDWNAIVKDIDDIMHDPSRWVVPTGAGYDAPANQGAKLKRLSRTYPDFFYEPFGMKYTGAREDGVDQDTWGRGFPVNPVRVQPVPKSYKASRIIAMEDTRRQSISLAIMNTLADRVPFSLNIRDQARNQYLAKEASITGLFATVDASNASDLISKSLFISIFPWDFVERILPLLGTHHEIDGQRRVMQMCSTSGHGLTFIIETIVYYSIATVACEWCALYEHITLPMFDYNGLRDMVSAYGDDTIVPSVAFPWVVSIFSACGLRINENKSYCSGPYRESCGEEYWNGTTVSSIYYPRFPLVGRYDGKSFDLNSPVRTDSYRGKIDNSSTMLADLQHRLFRICYPASRFVLSILQTVYPRLTTSKYGAPNDDLWEYDFSGQRIHTLPMYSLEVQDGERKFVRLPNAFDVSGCTGVTVEKHFVFSIRRTLAAPLTDYEERLYHSFTYGKFLREGPRYLSELDRLLGVSEPPISAAELFGTAQLVLIVKYDD